MEKSSSGRNETNQKLFDSYCKRILKNEAIDCFREIQKHRQREGYIISLSTRTLYDEFGNPHICVDENIRRRLQTKLIAGYFRRNSVNLNDGVIPMWTA